MCIFAKNYIYKAKLCFKPQVCIIEENLKSLKSKKKTKSGSFLLETFSRPEVLQPFIIIQARFEIIIVHEIRGDNICTVS